MKKRTRIILISAIAIVVAVTLAVGLYIADYYRADITAISAMAGSASVTVRTDGALTVFAPASPEVGFIFYPGGKVEHTAYAPLLLDLAEAGVLCVLVEMPANLAVLDPHAAEGIPARFPGIEHWYIGGHSLGGSMAASHVAAHTDTYDGLVLLASYSTADLRATDLSVLSLYGTEDGVLDRDQYDDCRPNLPAATTETRLEGANHAGFGCYGDQDGDGTATLPAAEQRRLTVDHMLDFFGISRRALANVS